MMPSRDGGGALAMRGGVILGSRRAARGAGVACLVGLVGLGLVGCGGGNDAADARFPPRPPGCAVRLFRGKVAGIAYDDVGRIDAICGTDIGETACLDELRNQACKLGGDLVYDVPDEPQKPSPDKVRFTGRVAHTRVAPAIKPAP